MKLWQAGGHGVRDEDFDVSLGETASSAGFGGGSRYSNENFEDWSGKSSMWTAVEHGLVDPKRQGNSVSKCSIMGHLSKKNLVNIPEPECGYSEPFGPNLQ